MTSAIACRERGRILYNLVLALVVLAHFAAAWPGSWKRVTLDLHQASRARANAPVKRGKAVTVEHRLREPRGEWT